MKNKNMIGFLVKMPISRLEFGHIDLSEIKFDVDDLTNITLHKVNTGNTNLEIRIRIDKIVEEKLFHFVKSFISHRYVTGLSDNITIPHADNGRKVVSKYGLISTNESFGLSGCQTR